MTWAVKGFLMEMGYCVAALLFAFARDGWVQKAAFGVAGFAFVLAWVCLLTVD